MTSPFLLGNQQSYLAWRKQKLANTPDYRQADPNALFIDVSNPDKPMPGELKQILQACKTNNMALYRLANNSPASDKKSILALARQCGLNHLDHNLCADDDDLTSITHTAHKGQHNYIPYSTKRLSWHTDGYYNTADQQVRGILLHCATPAKRGGESLLLDHEIAYILLRDENPAYIKALMQNDAMTIPANILDGNIIRDAQTGPVFSIDNNAQLHMRYSARKRNIEWKQDAHTLEAVSFLEALWEDAAKGNSPHVLKYTLQAGEGLICNNVLHCRTAFEDFEESHKKRLLYRGRYFDRVKEI
jgi:hypothetical protein